MELGLNFDDSFYESSVKEKKPPLTSYNAKFCSMLWFENQVSSQGCDDEMQLLKFSADYNFGQRKYQVALEKYKQTLQLLPEHNNSMHQDIMESIARCHLNLGNPEKAIMIANKLYINAVIPSHRTRHLVLLQHIYSVCGLFEGHKTVLHKLLLLHPTNIQYWIALASCYSQIISGSSSTPSSSSPSPSITEEFSNLLITVPAFHKQLTCLLRAKCLLKYSIRTTSSFVKKRHEKLLEKVDSDIELLNPDEDLVAKITQFITHDLGTQSTLVAQNTDEGEQTEQMNPKEEKEKDFEFIWFSWFQPTKNVQKIKTSNLSDVIK